LKLKPKLTLDAKVMGGSGERMAWGDWSEAVMLELAYKHPRTGKLMRIRQAVRIARQQPFEGRNASVGGVLGRDAEWDAEASALSRLELVLLLC
jgi:hypothetical protein